MTTGAPTQRRARGIVAACGLAWALGAACGGSGGGGGTGFVFPAVFPQGFLPVALAGGSSGDVAFRTEGDLYAVTGSADVSVISHVDGSVAVFASDVGGPGTVLLSAALAPDGRLFVADEDGIVYPIDAAGVVGAEIDTGPGPITGLAFAPAGFGALEGSLIAAAGGAGLRRITTGESPEVSDFEPTGSWVDLVFSGTTLFALDRAAGEIHTIAADGTPAFFEDGFDTPVGLGLDPFASELLIADAGDGTLRALPVAGGTPVRRAFYPYSATPPSGIAYDGAGALAWVTSGSVVIHGSTLPRIDPGNPSFGLAFFGPTVGYGDLELSRSGAFLFVANDPDDPAVEGDDVTNFFIVANRELNSVSTVARGIGEDGEALLSLAYDAASDTSYIGTDRGNVYRRAAEGGVELLVEASPEEHALLGLELAPDTFGAFGGHLVATTEAGEVLAIDPEAPLPTAIVDPPIETPAGTPARLSDLVFSLDGTLYVLDNGDTPDPADIHPRILIVDPDGTTTDLGANPDQLGLPDGLEIDEGGERLLVAISDDPADLLVEVSLVDAAVAPLAEIPLGVRAGFFPTGVVYDRLGTAVVRQGDDFTSLGAFRVVP